MHSDWQMCAGDPIFGSTRAGNLLQKVDKIHDCHVVLAFQKVGNISEAKITQWQVSKFN